MDIFRSLLGGQIVFITSIINLAMLIVVFFSCRCVPTSKVFGGLMKYPWFKKFYKVHCYFWYVFFTSVTIHVVFAVVRVGIPF